MKRKLITSLAAAVAGFSFSVAQAETFENNLPSTESTIQLPVVNGLNYGDSASCQTAGQWVESWKPLDDLYSPFATYTLTYEQQVEYLSLIQKIWPWNYSYMQPWEVNDAMADVVNIVMEEIISCSQAMPYIQFVADVYTFFLERRAERGGSYQWAISLYADHVKDNISDIFTTIDLVEGLTTYKSCVNTAAWYWRSPFEMAYWDY